MTDQLKHTPGPWRAGIGEDAMPTRNEFEQEIACLPHMYLDAIDIFAPKRDDASPHHCCTEEFEANAHLIAAAPDMYEALRALLRLYGRPLLEHAGEDLASEWSHVRAAIAKAEGVHLRDASEQKAVSDADGRQRDMEASNGEWQDISTAPKDGTDILVCLWGTDFGVTCMMVVSYDPDQRTFPWITLDGGQGYHVDAPTHWMPLPAPPATPRDKQEVGG